MKSNCLIAQEERSNALLRKRHRKRKKFAENTTKFPEAITSSARARLLIEMCEKLRQIECELFQRVLVLHRICYIRSKMNT